jgi:hypothetical protein
MILGMPGRLDHPVAVLEDDVREVDSPLMTDATEQAEHVLDVVTMR